MKKMESDDFNKLVRDLNPNIILVSDYINNITDCNFKCLKCNSTFIRTPKRFKQNPTCRWCNLKDKSKKHSAFMKGKKTNILTVDKFKNKCKSLENDYIIYYDTYTNRNNKVKITHKKCSRTFEMVAKNFVLNPRCLCCVEDLRKSKISSSLRQSDKFKSYTSNKNLLCKSNFNKKVYNIVGDEYSFLEDYIDSHTNIKVKHNLCGTTFEVSPVHFLSKGTRCPYCFRTSSNLEKDVYNYINSIYDGTILRNDRNIIYPQELDIYIPDKNIALEFNGNYWHSTKYKDKKYHFNKSTICEQRGIRLIHIWEYEWNNLRQRPILEDIIKNALGINANKIYARCLDIEVKASKDMKSFFETNNIQGFRPGKFAICLVDKLTREVYMSYIMGNSFFGKGKYDWEVIRGATKLGCSVIGGASKIWSYFIKNYNPKNCVYYIDYNYFNGNSLKNLPNLQYVKTQFSFKNYWVKENCVKNRNPKQHKLIKELESEGLVIPIYNAGTKVYVWKK